VGSAWEHHYDRLHLHTPKSTSHLPGLPFPRDFPRYPSRAQMGEYLRQYCERFELRPLFGQCVVRASRHADLWCAETEDCGFESPTLVVATGLNRQPWIPTWPGRDVFEGVVMHSGSFRNALGLRGHRVLVVGFGNSGGEIALDACEHGANTTLSVRGGVQVVPREILGIPVTTLAAWQERLPARWADALNAPLLAAIVGDLSRWGLRPAAPGPLERLQAAARVPLIDVGTIRLIREGRIAVRPGIARFTVEGVAFEDGTQARFDLVILATGYRPALREFLSSDSHALDSAGMPLASGRELSPGLYFCGFRVAPGGMLREIGREARRIAAHIAAAARVRNALRVQGR
jgi:hypothetical protein